MHLPALGASAQFEAYVAQLDTVGGIADRRRLDGARGGLASL
jgi:hypothetical protein